ncbi:MAG: hypothetical protein C4306_10950, partial [Thermoleophilia bacterium]
MAGRRSRPPQGGVSPLSWWSFRYQRGGASDGGASLPVPEPERPLPPPWPPSALVIVRQARAEDREALRALQAELEAEAGRRGSSLAGGGSAAEPDREAVEAQEVVLVAEEAGGLVGYAEVRLEAPRGWLRAIYVQPSSRRQGIARRLLAEVVGCCRALGVGTLGLELPVDGGEARRLAERLGFQPVSVRLEASIDNLERQVAGVGKRPS